MKLKMILVVLVVAMLSATITYMMTKSRMNPPALDEHGREAEAREEGGAVEIAGLQTAVAEVGEGWDAIAVTGKVTVPPDRLVKISPRIEGKIVAARGTVGDSVSRGQTLAVISSVELAEARASYRRALATLSAAQRNYERETQIVKLGAVSVRPVEEARSESLEAQGDLADAKSEASQAKSEQSRAESELTQCRARLERARELYSDKIVSKQDVETAEAEFSRDSAEVDAAKSRVSQAEAKIEKAAARADIARQYLDREQKMYKGKAYDLRAIQTVRAELAAAKVEARAAADGIRALGANPGGSGDTIAIVSPIAGRIVARHTNVGEMATPADALFTVANLDRMWVEADVYEKDLAKARRGQMAEIRVDAYPDRVFHGVVDSVGDILNAESRTAKIRCVVTNHQALLKGEMFARINLVTAKRDSAVLIPKQAVLDEAGKQIVFTVCRECAKPDYEKAEVTTGPSRGDRIEVLSGLEAGTEVVTVGAYQLKTSLGSATLKAGCTDAGCED